MDEQQKLLMRCLDNTATEDNWEELGILVFGRTFFPDVFDSKFSIMHYRILKHLLELYNPKRERRTERQLYINIHREAAKTTISSFLFPLYQIFLKGYQTLVAFEQEDGTFVSSWVDIGERFIMLCSETATAAENLVTNIKTIIEQRTDMIAIFGDKHPQAIQLDDEDPSNRKGDKLWRKNAFITGDNTVVYGIGSGQQVRGKNVLNSRPTLIIVDDMYGDNKVLTEHSRERLNKWFYAGLLNSGDSLRCKTAWLGTLVHIDTVITKMKKSESWFGVVIPIIQLDELRTALTHCTITPDECHLPSKAQCKEIQGTLKTLSWGERHTLYSILMLYKQSYEDKNLKYFYQEYLNVTEPPEEESFPDRKFLKVKLTTSYAQGEFTVSFEHQGIVWRAKPVFEAGIDWASGESKKSDDVVLCLVAICLWQGVVPGSNKLIEKVLPLYYHMEGGKYGIYDETMTNGALKRGICNALTAINSVVPLSKITMEINGQQASIAREIRRYMNESKMKTLLTERRVQYYEQFSQGNKEERIRSVMEPIVQKYEFVVVNGDCAIFNKMISQLQTLGSTDHDDYADGAAIATAKVKKTSLLVHQKQKIENTPHENYLLTKLTAPYVKVRTDAWQTY